MQVTRIIYNNVYPHQSENKNNFKNDNKNIDTNLNKNYELPNYKYYISFEGVRVDKGLERFFQANKDRMPATVYRFIEKLSDKSIFTPLEAQRRAFSKLLDEEVKTVADIKRIFPKNEEELFDSLIEVSETKATRGILSTYRENKDLLNMFELGILKDKENFTVYLIKKIYLEGKTLDEINADLIKDIDKDFYDLFKRKNPNAQKLIQDSTLKALGIKTPDASYQQSLRYTRDGYSDTIGETISKAQRQFWDSLSDEERTARAKKSLEKFENWWGKLTQRQKLEMIAEQDSQLKMLKDFKASEGIKDTPKTSTTTEPQTISNIATESERTHTHIGSKQLSRDELFVKWASNNLKIFEEGLSELQKRELEFLRMQKLVQHWQNMTPVQKNEYIQRMKAGSEPMRFAMIDAWNNSQDIILELSRHLKESQIFKPHDVLYSSQEFSEFQSSVMKAFWEQHPDFADKLGEQIKLSQEKIQNAINSGKFEALKKEILKDKSRRINEIVAVKVKTETPNTTPTQTQQPTIKIPEKPQFTKTYKDEFIEAFKNTNISQIKNQPKKYLEEYSKLIADEVPEDIIKIWTRYMRGEYVSASEIAYLKESIKTATPAMARLNRSFEAAMADTVARFTGNPQAYELSHSDLKTVMYHLERGEHPIQIISHTNNQMYTFNIIQNPKKIDRKQIDRLYDTYLEKLSDNEIDKIINNYFGKENNTPAEAVESYTKALKEYIKNYGKSIFILFSEKSKYSVDIKTAFNKKFLIGMMEDMNLNSSVKPLLIDRKDIQKEEYLSHLRHQFSKKYDFMPQSFVDLYFDKIALNARVSKDLDIHTLDLICKKRTQPSDGSRMMLIRDSILENRKEILAMEQALADVLYEATGNYEVYGLKLESLMDKLELFRLVKDFPTQESPCLGIGKENFMISAKKRPNTGLVTKKYKEYLAEMNQWEKELKETPENYNDLIYILNPEEEKEMIDFYTGLRLGSFGFNTNIGKININVKKP